MTRSNDEKRNAARAAVELVEDGMLLGLGSGSTVVHAVDALAMRVQQGLRVDVVVASRATQLLAERAGFRVVGLDHALPVDLTIDGADEVDPWLRLTKGGGGALLREKVLAYASRATAIVVDASKCVQVLGRFPLPIEVLPFAAPVVLGAIRALGCDAKVRTFADGSPFRTDQDNFVVDCAFVQIDEPRELAELLDRIPGALGHGLFLTEASYAFVGRGTRVTRVFRPGEAPDTR